MEWKYWKFTSFKSVFKRLKIIILKLFLI
jgi:hypothetical protein